MTEAQNDIVRIAIAQLAASRTCGVVWSAEFIEDVVAGLRALVAERDALKSDANLVSLNAVNAALAAEVAVLKAQPVSNSDELASIPLKSWVIEVFHHLCHSPHTPDEWKRDLDRKTQAVLNAIDQGKKGER